MAHSTVCSSSAFYYFLGGNFPIPETGTRYEAPKLDEQNRPETNYNVLRILDRHYSIYVVRMGFGETRVGF